MDTRNKIVTAERAREIAGNTRRAGARVIAVTGYFDVLLAEHARELRRRRDGVEDAAIIVFVTSPPEPILSARARAEMVAAFAMVDYVVIPDDGSSDIPCGFEADEIVRTEVRDAERTLHLIEHVHRRQRA